MYSKPVECALRRKGYKNKNTRKQEDIDYTYSRTLYQCNYPHFGQCFPSVLILVLANGFEVILNFFLSFKHPLNSLAYPVCSSFKTHAESNSLSHLHCYHLVQDIFLSVISLHTTTFIPSGYFKSLGTWLPAAPG